MNGNGDITIAWAHIDMYYVGIRCPSALLQGKKYWNKNF